MNYTLLRVAAAGFVFFQLLDSLASTGAAQSRPNRYAPSRPTVSPYLNLTRRDAGALPNYYSLVRPQLEQRAINQQQQIANQRQQTSVRALEGQITQLSEPRMRSTGTGTSFSNLSHYFPPTNPRSRPPRQRR